MRLFLPKCIGITLLCCLYSFFLSAQTGPGGVNSGTVLWLDASDVNAGGATPALGSSVTTWRDKSGGNRNATSSGTNTAVFTSGGANSTRVIRFNRSSATSGTGFTVSGLDIRAATNPEVTIFAVYKQGTNDGNTQAVWGNDNNGPQRFFNSKWSSGATDGSLSTGGTAAVIPNASGVGETKLVTGIYAAGSNASAVYINGKKISNFTDMTAASSGQSVFRIGSDGDNNYFNGDVSEIIVYNRKLTDCELETVNRYLSNKYQLDFVNIGANYSLGQPVNYDIAGVGRPASVCSGTYNVMTSTSDIVMVTNPSSSSTAGVILTFANDRRGYGPSSETPPAYVSRLSQRWRADLNGNIGTVDICFNLEGLGIDVTNSGNFALLIDKDGNFSDATAISSGVTVFVDRVCISNVPITKGDYFTLATVASTSMTSTITSPNQGIFRKAAFNVATVVDNQIQVKGNDTITNARAYIDSGFVAGDILAITTGTLPAGVTSNYNAATGGLTFTGKATAAQWQVIFRGVTFRTTSGTTTDRIVKFSLGNVVSYTVGSKPHYYEYVTSTMNWVNAKAAAEARTLYGLRGYLATVTSQIENDFITAKLSADGWVGASCNYQQVNTAVGSTVFNNQAAADGRYYWVTGPEKGQPISTGLNTPTAVGSAFMNWNGGEPNNYNGTNEQYVQLYSTNAGRWNDLPLTSNLGYVVEYGGYASDSVLNIEYRRTVRSAPAAPVIVSITNDSGSSNSDRITNDSTLVFAGTSPANAIVTLLREDLGVIGNTTANGSGAWTFDYTGTILTDGTYNFTAVDTVAQVESAMSNVFQVTIDRTAPAKPTAPVLTSGSTYANTLRPTFTGSAEPGSTVTLYDNGTARGSARADSTGRYTITATSNMNAGTHANVYVRAVDIAGNTSVNSDASSIIVDVTAPNTPPRPVLVGGTTGGVIASHTPTINGTAEANSTVIIFVDGVRVDSVTANGSGNYTYTFATPLPDATYSVTVRAKDAAGNVSNESPALSITVDTTAPLTPAAPELVGGNNGVTNNNRPTITGIAEANSTVIIFRNGTRIDSVTADAGGSYNYTFPTALPDATYSITVRSKDVVGNVSNMSPALSLTIDTVVPNTPPAPTLVGGNNNVTNNNRPTIQGNAEPNTTIIIYRDGTVLDSVPVSAAGTYSYTFLTALPDATYAITVRDKDAAGNRSGLSPALNISVDTQAPVTPAAPVLVGGNNNITNNNRPTIEGVAENNSTVIIFRDGVRIDSVTANSSGNYTYTFPTALPDATYSITVRSKDAAGNVSNMSPALSLTVDTQAPVTPPAPTLVGGNNNVTNDNTPTIEGTAENNSTVIIFRDGVRIDSVTAGSTGNYTYTFPTALPDATYSIRVRSKDAAGNVSNQSPALNITVDTQAPATPAAPTLVGGNNGITNNNRPTIEGIAEANSTVIIFRDGVRIDSVIANSTGNYTYTFPTALPDATYAITVRSKDAAGNVSNQSPALSLTVDTQAPPTPPAPTLVGSTNNITNDNTPTIEGSAEANSTVIIFRDGVRVDSVIANASGNYTYTFPTALADDTYSITVRSKDAAGNVSNMSPALNFRVDTHIPNTPPAPTLVGGNNGVTNNNRPTITGTAETNSTVIIYKDGVRIDSVTASAIGVYNYTFPTALADDTYSITVRSKDAAGNISMMSAALSLTVDTQAPNIPPAPTLVGGNNGVINNSRPTIQETAEANSTVIIFRDGVRVDSVTANGSGNYTYTFPTALADDTYSITVRSKDAAGNVSNMSPALSITIDTAAPNTPPAPTLVGGNNGVTNDNTPTIEGTAEANSTVIIFRDGVRVDSVLANNSGNYTYTFPTALPDATYSITVRSKDAGNNISGMSPALNITVDTAAPTTPPAPTLVGGSNGITNNNTPTIEGTAEANSTVIIFKDGVRIDSVTANNSGNYTYTFPTALPDSTYSITVRSKDAAGNVSNMSPALSLTIDTNLPATPTAPILVGGNDGLTNDATPDIRGAAEANSTVSVYVDGVKVGETTANAGGNYTYTFPSDLTEGAHAITVTATDAAGNTSAQSPALNITIDTQAPSVPPAPELVDGRNNMTTDPTPDIKGTAEKKSIVDIYLNGTKVGAAVADVNGDYTYHFGTELVDGPYVIRVTATDTAGNTSALSAALNITVDAHAPLRPAAPELVGGINGNNTNDATPDIRGKAEANSTVSVYADGVKVGETTADASGNYIYTFTNPLNDGAHAIAVTATDAAGNTSPRSPALNINIDTHAPGTPTIPILVGGNEGMINTDKPTITGKAEPNSTVTVYVDGVKAGTTPVDAGGNYTYTFENPLADGPHDITVTATDAVGNTSDHSSPALNIIIDTKAPDAPSVPILVSDVIDGYVQTEKPTVRGTAEPNSTVTIYDGGVAAGTAKVGADGNWTYTFENPIANGAHAVTATATDVAGNTSVPGGALNFNVDAFIPAVPSPPRLPGVNGRTNTTTPTIVGQGEPNTLINIYTDGEKVGTAVVDANGNWTYTYTTPLSESVHNISVTASKLDGGTESGHSTTVKLTIDLVGPTVKLSTNTVAGAVVNGTVQVTVTFSESVSGFSWNNMKITNGKVTGFMQVSAGIYQVMITPSENGKVTIWVPDNAGIDVIGNGNLASDLLTLDMTSPIGIGQVYPLPATDVVNVRFDGVKDADAFITMTNMAGQVLQSQYAYIKNGVMTMNVQRLPSGSYVLLVRIKNESYHTTVVIAR